MTEVVLPWIDMARCTGCGTCAERCPDGIVTIEDGVPSFGDATTCSYCGLCEDICPAGAIALTFRVVGQEAGVSLVVHEGGSR